uniref:Uncharacterized protein n=1 Tax=Arundo donax TaxID=35708 RepID=A0A0A9B6Z3_ARUDO
MSLYCLWPFPFELFEEKSMLYSFLASASAMLFNTCCSLNLLLWWGFLLFEL